MVAAIIFRALQCFFQKPIGDVMAMMSILYSVHDLYP